MRCWTTAFFSNAYMSKLFYTFMQFVQAHRIYTHTYNNIYYVKLTNC